VARLAGGPAVDCRGSPGSFDEPFVDEPFVDEPFVDEPPSREVSSVAENDAVDKALRLFVYAPLGIAAYVRDSAPSLLTVFVARGQRELAGVRRAVEERLGLTEPEPTAAPPLQRVADGIGRLASQAGSVVVGVARPVVDAASAAASSATSSSPSNGEAMHWAATRTGANGAESAAAGRSSTSSTSNATGLPIADYDGLSATQIIDRLEGLSRGALERIRVYELAHRARRTILATIDQLTS
jgi:hypothetical protein